MAHQRTGILGQYDLLREEAKDSLASHHVSDRLTRIYRESLRCLSRLTKVELISQVPGKRYFAFDTGRKLSRAVNEGLYAPNPADWDALRTAMASGDVSGIEADAITRTLYTMAISFCAAIDVIKDDDQKTPGTFFEFFIAHFFTWRVGVEPTTSIQVLNVDGEDTRLQTDFIFNLGPKRRKFHMPIKTSTRERSIMLWAHQRLLDGVYGTGRFMGTPVLLAETKTDKKKREVVEICLPDQWKVYQLYIAKLKRIYYLDIPSAYKKLNEEFPPLSVRPFGEFFSEWSDLAPD